MLSQPICLIDPSSARIATLDVSQTGDLYSGTICLDATPPELIDLFQQFEEMVEGQMFSLLDDIEEKIEATRLRVVFENGSVACLSDLQVYPSTNAVSFKCECPPKATEEAGSAPEKCPNHPDEQFVDASDQAFLEAAAYVLKKNAELYRRLA